MPVNSFSVTDSFSVRGIATLALLAHCAMSQPLFADESIGKGAESEIQFFESRIRPVLVEHCYECHSADADEVKGNLRVDTREGLLEGGNNGEAVVPGKVDEGFLLPALRYEEDDYQMPPDGKLPDAILADIEKWIEMGAPDPRTTKKSNRVQ